MMKTHLAAPVLQPVIQKLANDEMIYIAGFPFTVKTDDNVSFSLQGSRGGCYRFACDSASDAAVRQVVSTRDGSPKRVNSNMLRVIVLGNEIIDVTV